MLTVLGAGQKTEEEEHTIKESVHVELDEPALPPVEGGIDMVEDPDMSSVVFFMSLGVGWYLSPIEFDRYVGSVANYRHLLFP